MNFNGAWLGTDMTAVIRGGDGITVYESSNCTIINNYVHHIYDNALTNELCGTDDEWYAENNTYKGNIVDASSGGILICDWEALQSNKDSKPLFKNIKVEDNYVMNTGYGWSHRELDYDWGQAGPVNNGNCSIFFGFPAKTGKDISVSNNILYLSKYALVGELQGRLQQNQRYPITFSGNTYVQNSMGLLAELQSPENYKIIKNYTFNMNAKKTITNVMGDKKGVVL